MPENYSLDFKEIKPSDVSLLRAHLSKNPKRICDFTAGSIYMWSTLYSTQFATDSDALYLRVKYPIGYCYAISSPLEKYVACAKKLYDLCNVGCRPLVLCAVTHEENTLLEQSFAGRITSTLSRNWSDYIYPAAEMREFAGKKYHGQKNHINAFVRDNPDWRFKPVNSSNYAALLDFYSLYKEKNSKDTASAVVEAKAVENVLSVYEQLDLLGGILFSGDDIVGFSIGEISGSTLFVHIEKASLEFRGAYQMLVREFARAYTADDIVHINREEDDGDEGLRTSKLSYRPSELIDKYLVAIE